MKQGQEVKADISANENGKCIIDAVIIAINDDKITVREIESNEEWDLKKELITAS